MRRVLLLAAPLLLPSALPAQRLTPSFASVTVPLTFDSVQARKIPRTYWLEGGIIGGVTLGVLTALEAHKLYDSPGPHVAGTIAVSLLVGAVGFTAGSLIGGQFRKPSP